MVNLAITGFPVVACLCMLCASAAPHSDGDCSGASASGVCPKRGASMLQTSSSIAAVQHHQAPQDTVGWSVISLDHGCEHNDDGINRIEFVNMNSLAACQAHCLRHRQCRAIDFYPGNCSTFSQPCSTPKTSVYGIASFAFSARIAMDPCNQFKMVHKGTNEEVPLRPRSSPVRVIDFSQIAFEHELPLLRMRLAEMGPYVDEFHIAEGDHDFSGRPKEFVLPGLLDSDPDLAQWRSKIVHHKVDTTGFQKETVHVADEITGPGVLLEGDIDEIMSRPFLNAIKHCEPITENWTATVSMPFLRWNMGWSPCDNCDWWDATLVHDIDIKIPSFWDAKLSQFSALHQQLQAKTSYVKGSDYVMVRVDGRPTGWHISWTVDGAQGLANKYLHGWSHPGWTGTVPEYLQPHMGNSTALAKFLDERFLQDPLKFEPFLKPSILTRMDLPDCVVQNPDKFKVQLGSRLYNMIVNQ